MRKIFIQSLLTLGICATAAAPVKAQDVAIHRDYVEVPGFSLGVNFGLLDLWGDIGTQSVVDHYLNEVYWKDPHFMGGIFVRYSAHPALAVRATVNYGTLYATDEWNINKAREATSIEADAYQRYLRNQDVRANTWEGALLLEFSPLRMNVESKLARRSFQPYILAGVGGFHFRPQTTYYDPSNPQAKKWVDLADKSVETEGFPGSKASMTNLWQLCFPAGLGVKWDLNEELAFGVEYLYRFTMIDRLDMVASEYTNPNRFDRYLSEEQELVSAAVYDKSFVIEPSVKHASGEFRGNTDVNDYFSTISVTFYYKIKNKKNPWWY